MVGARLHLVACTSHWWWKRTTARVVVADGDDVQGMSHRVGIPVRDHVTDVEAHDRSEDPVVVADEVGQRRVARVDGRRRSG